jgi:lysophospholipase L1-like esterase
MLRAKSLQYSPSLFARHVFPLKEQMINERGWFINEKGYRGKIFSQKKDEGVIRIIVYGGSAVFDQNVPNGKDWPSRIQDSLKKRGLKNTEVINAGIPGHAAFDSFGRFFAEGHFYEPDYVILYSAWNDIKYFSSKLPLLRRLEPYKESRDPRIHYQGEVDRILCELSQLYVRFRGRYYRWRYNIGGEGIIKNNQNPTEIGDIGIKQYTISIKLFVDLAKNINAVPILVTQARLVSKHNTEKEKSQIRYDYQGMEHQKLIQAFEKTDEILNAVARAKRVSLITDASQKMTGKSEYFSDHIHLSDKGSKQLALIISKYLYHFIQNRNIDPI